MISIIAIESERKVIRHDVQRNHGFREFVNTQMILAQVNGAAKEMLLGHSIGLDDKYYRPNPAQLLEEYTKAIDLLTINEEIHLRKKVEQLTLETSDISIIKQRVDKLMDVVIGSNANTFDSFVALSFDKVKT